jgi:hypothetical protein
LISKVKCKAVALAYILGILITAGEMLTVDGQEDGEWAKLG